MKIAILGIKTFPAFAGADRVVEELVTRFPREYQFYIYLSKIDNKQIIDSRDNLNFIYIPTIRGKHLKAFVFFLLSTFHVIIKGKYDIINIHNSDFGFLNPIIFFKNKNIIATFHGSGYKRDKWGLFAKTFLKFSEFLFIRFNKSITVVSKKIIQEIPNRYREKVKYIPNGIDSSNIKINRTGFNYLDYQIKKGEYFLFACGRLDKTKGLHHLIHAYLSGNYSQKLLVIGDFNHDFTYSKYIREMSSKDSKIILHDSLIPKPILFDILDNSRLFIFPSEIEAMSMMLLEAIAIKANIICSDIEENVAVIGDDYKYLFKNKDVNDLKTKIDSCLSDNSMLTIKEQLFEKVNLNFNWNNIVKEYENVYKNIK